MAGADRQVRPGTEVAQVTLSLRLPSRMLAAMGVLAVLGVPCWTGGNPYLLLLCRHAAWTPEEVSLICQRVVLRPARGL